MSQSKRKIDDLYIKRDDLYDDIMQLSKQHHCSPFSSSTQSSTPYSIYKVPRTLRGLKPRAYNPRVVSIGLIHAEDPHVQPMNVHKESYMCSLFHRTAISKETCEKDVGETIGLCVKAMASQARRAGICYPPSVQFDDTTTARTMLVDGCFLLELLMRSSIIKENKRELSDPIFRKENKKREHSDPIFRNNLKVRDVVHDLILLENQIPFFILEQLFRLTVKQIQNPPAKVISLTHLILEFFGNMMNSKFELKIEDGKNENADHILGLLHSCYRPGVSDPGDYMIKKYSAAELHRSGVNFKPSKGDDYKYLLVDFQTPCLFSWLPNIISNCLFAWLLAIARTIFKTPSCSGTASKRMFLSELPVSVSGADPTEKPMSVSEADTIKTPAFVSETDPAREPVSAPNPVGKHKCCLFSCLCQLCCRPTLEIPQLCITDSTEPFLRNLIAFEQCSQNTPRHITSYAFLMDTIINSKEHVELLESGEVLQNYLGTGEDASNLFNNLCKEVILGEFYFSKQWEQVDHYCKLYWPSCIASMRRTYFSSPWTGISVVAALILFAFTGIQTICSLISL